MKHVLVVHLNDWTDYREKMWTDNGCGTTQEWHVHYVAEHNATVSEPADRKNMFRPPRDSFYSVWIQQSQEIING